MPCETTINGDGIYQIPDARRDPEYAPNGVPVGDKRYRFYAGAPVLTPESVTIGCVVVLDTSARKLTAPQLEALESLSNLVTTRLESRAGFARTDIPRAHASEWRPHSP